MLGQVGRHWHSLTALAVLLVHFLGVVRVVKSEGASVSKPNIIFILADDMAWGSGGWGTRTDSDLDFVTPHLNALSEKSIKFSQYYTQEVCTPARASLLTGRSPFTMGMQYGGVEASVKWGLNMSETLMSEPLSDAGYTTYMLGKWNLGHFTAKLLPSERGFDYWMGYDTGSMYYWSKKDPNSGKSCSSGTCEHESLYFNALLYGDDTCYAAYDGSDKHTYSTTLFKDKAVNVIENHEYTDSPLFMYLAFQAVHDPFEDLEFPNGLPKSYLEQPAMYGLIKSGVDGRKRRQYAMSLNVLDSAINSIVSAVSTAGQDDNTYIIFTGDNGGCYSAGGRNGPLRGNKGLLFEGGTKVDALIYSAKFHDRQQGATYSGLSHVSDWFPTIMDMAGVSFTASTGYSLDGVSHWDNLKKIDKSDTTQALTSPRSVMLYNYYDKVEAQDGWGDTPVRAVRDSQYKLIETWVGTTAGWFNEDTTLDDDSDLTSYGTCQQAQSWKKGTYTQMLFDLANDPYEENNLYGHADYADTQAKLYAHLDVYYANGRTDYLSYSDTKAAYKTFKKSDNSIVPWEKMTDEGSSVPTLKNACSNSLVGPNTDIDDFTDTDPTTMPTVGPTGAKHGKKTKTKSKHRSLRAK